MKKLLNKSAQKIRDLPTSIYLAIIVGLALLARLFNLTKASIWHDEGYTATIINLSPSEIIQVTINDVHPPFYYLLLHYWQAFFGSSVVSLRGFSVACGIAVVVLMYFLLRRLFPVNIARLGALFVAIGPFLVRYSQEARMYSLATLIVVGATYVLVRALLSKSNKSAIAWWLSYGVLIALGLYTQYFITLVVPAHLIYAWLTYGGGKVGAIKLFRQPGLWISGVVGLALFIPWLPSMISQVTRVSGGFWIPPVDWFSIPDTLSMFMTYNHEITKWLGVTFTVFVIGLAIWLSTRLPRYRPAIWLLLSWSLLPMIIVALLSLRNPVFQKRYFTFSAPAFYALLAVSVLLLVRLNKLSQQKLIIGVSTIIVLLFIGIGTVYDSANHQMGTVAGLVNSEYQPGDKIVSAELYTFFDFSYYNQTGSPVKLLSEEEFGKYGEWGLIRAIDTERVAELSGIDSERVWVVGKTGDNHDYFTTSVPSSWRIITEASAGDSVVKLFETGR